MTPKKGPTVVVCLALALLGLAGIPTNLVALHRSRRRTVPATGDVVVLVVVLAAVLVAAVLHACRDIRALPVANREIADREDLGHCD